MRLADYRAGAEPHRLRDVRMALYNTSVDTNVNLETVNGYPNEVLGVDVSEGTSGGESTNRDSDSDTVSEATSDTSDVSVGSKERVQRIAEQRILNIRSMRVALEETVVQYRDMAGRGGGEHVNTSITSMKNDISKLLSLEEKLQRLLAEVEGREYVVDVCEASFQPYKEDRMEPSTHRSSYPVPLHNFPTPLVAAHRDPDWHGLIGDVNIAQRTLGEMAYSLFSDGDGPADLRTLLEMKEFIEDQTVPEMTKALKGLVLHPGMLPRETVHTPCRDALVNIGAGFFISGLYLIMMGSNTAQDYQATAANFHLRRGVVMDVKSICTVCGHNNCYSTSCDGDAAYATNGEDEEV